MSDSIIQTKSECLVAAVEITKAYGHGGAVSNPKVVLDEAYKKLVELMTDANKKD